jgi:DNA-directed RNA polymerase specialized sigma24 family protein
MRSAMGIFRNWPIELPRNNLTRYSKRSSRHSYQLRENPSLQWTVCVMDATEISLSSSIATCVPALRGVSFALTGNRQSADELAEKAIIWFSANRTAVFPERKLKVRMLSIVHDLYYIAGHQCREAIQSLAEQSADEPTASSSYQDSIKSDDFKSAFWQLRDNEREVLVLEDGAGLTCPEIAEICGCTTAMIDMREFVRAPAPGANTLWGGLIACEARFVTEQVAIRIRNCRSMSCAAPHVGDVWSRQ